MQNPMAKDSPWLGDPKRLLSSLTTGMSNLNLKAYLKQDGQLNRLGAHLIVGVLIAVVLVAGGMKLSRRQLRLPHYVGPQLDGDVVEIPDAGNPLTLSGQLKNRRIGILQPAAVLQPLSPIEPSW